MSTPALWVTIAGAGAVTFALRLSFIALLGRMDIPPWLGRALRFVPAAVLTAVVIPQLLYDSGPLEVSLSSDRLLAGLVAALIAWRTRSVLFTLGGGMAGAIHNGVAILEGIHRQGPARLVESIA